ncbi:MAG: UDP-N-acetylmuramoyl-L-alanyl-D-glutamate--2,6-diaminopimelate ligase [Planctomycetota bacterium]
MRLADLIREFDARPGLGFSGATVGSTAGRWADLVVRDLTDDSRAVTPGMLFVARRGADPKQDPGRFVPQALDNGAAAVLAEPGVLRDHAGLFENNNAVGVEADVVDTALASRAAHAVLGRPSHKLAVLGITGTNGKSTTAMLTRHLLAAGGVKAGLIGTIETDTGGPEGPRVSELTTPGPVETVRRLAEMVRHGCAAAVMEVSSHALHQGRCAALRFAAACLTNLTQDHLDYHGTMEAYADAKAILFSMLPEDATAVVNADDPWAGRIAQGCKARRMYTRLQDGQDDVEPGALVASIGRLGIEGADVRWHGPEPGRVVEARLPLIGRFNVANATQALALARAAVELDDPLAAVALRGCPQTPGRVERVKAAAVDLEKPVSDGPTVFVDYAHTPDALDNVGQALGPLARASGMETDGETGRLITVFGCGGDRDRAKRPLMMQAALRHADVVWLTSDNPRTEDPQQILGDALAGVDSDSQNSEKEVRVDIDRALAIRRAIAEASPGDTVLIAGKGHEDYQVVSDGRGGSVKAHFDDREHAAQALAAR